MTNQHPNRMPEHKTELSNRSEHEISLSYSSIQSSSQPPPVLQHPTRLITFSYTSTRELEFNDSAKRYYVPPPPKAQLSNGYDRWTFRPDVKNIDNLLRAYVEKRKRGDSTVSLDDVDVVCWRGVMTKILIAPYGGNEGWSMNAMFHKGTMYFEEYVDLETEKRMTNMTARQRKQTYYGHAFESYCASETPIRQPGWGGDVNTNIQWCNVVHTKLGDIKMVLGGEVDCVKDDSLVELKTSMDIRNAHDEARFQRKLLRFYIQSTLLGVPEIIVGFRTNSGEVTQVKHLQTAEIPRKRNSWNKNKNACLKWGVRFLGLLKQTVKDNEVWRVLFVPDKGVQIYRLDAEQTADVERVGFKFLPRWYLE